MLRFILRIFGIRDFEPCQSCENLKEQLRYERETNFRLTDTIVKIVSPKVVEAAPVEINQVQQSSALFSRRRAELEKKDRAEALIIAQKRHVAMPDDIVKEYSISDEKNKVMSSLSVEQLEKELGVEGEMA